ncbi:MAG TPA: squalene/phytoene synthase family protein [Dictyobacter sp.]|jgi:phytoene synthase|nr:squalene/phytoene synthase family protein [Dictyobacter sp.]
MQLVQHHGLRGVNDAYEYCRRVTQHASKTFYWGSLFLPPPKRYAIWAVYAFCRKVDDIVDEAFSGARLGHFSGSPMPLQEIERWRQALIRFYQTGLPDDDPLFQAWAQMLELYPVPLQPALELLDGVEMDLTKKRYTSFEELYLYCYRVAGTVGLLTAPIFGYEDEKALAHAVELGIGLQLTNILRDIGEDAQIGRIYLPLDEIERFGYSEEALMHGVVNDAFRQLLSFQMGRAHDYYQRSLSGIALLHEDSQLAVTVSSVLYRRILDRICLNDFNVFTTRASVPLLTKLSVASAYWFMQQVEITRALPHLA